MDNLENYNTVDCEERGFGIDKVVREIMRSENSLLRRIPRDQKVVILLGQLYNKAPLHIELYKAVLNAHVTLQDAVENRSFGFGYEGPVNGYIPRANFDSVRKIAAYFEREESQRFFQDERDLFAFCEENNIPTAFTDVAQDASRGQHVDFKDAFTQAVMDKYRLDVKKRINGSLHIQEDEAMRLGIVCTGERIAGLMQEERQRIFVQQCSMHRVVGYQKEADTLCIDHKDSRADKKQPGLAFTDSLYDHLTKREFAVLPVFINFNEASNDFPPGSEDALRKSVIVTNFNQSRYPGTAMKDVASANDSHSFTHRLSALTRR